jgi:hypothetical protein
LAAAALDIAAQNALLYDDAAARAASEDEIGRLRIAK